MEILASDPNYLRGARAVVEDYARRLRELDRLVEHSTLTEERAIELGRKARKRIYAKFQKQ